MCPIGGGKGKKKATLASQPFPILHKKAEDATAVKIGNSIQGNPVGELQELCTSKKWPMPKYEELEEWGPAHALSFKFRVSINDGTATISEEGSGSGSKKLVKKLVAMQMIKRLKNWWVEDIWMSRVKFEI